jgi:hypothetical protein
VKQHQKPTASSPSDEPLNASAAGATATKSRKSNQSTPADTTTKSSKSKQPEKTKASSPNTSQLYMWVSIGTPGIGRVLSMHLMLFCCQIQSRICVGERI